MLYLLLISTEFQKKTGENEYFVIYNEQYSPCIHSKHVDDGSNKFFYNPLLIYEIHKFTLDSKF